MSHKESTAHQLLDDLEVIEQLLNESSSQVLHELPDDVLATKEEVMPETAGTYQAVIHPAVSTPLVVLPGIRTDHRQVEVPSATDTRPSESLSRSLEEQLRQEGDKMIQDVIDGWLPRLESRLRCCLNQAMDQYIAERIAAWQDTSSTVKPGK
ncbi:hypothetical protein ACWJJH_11370 [Endozoicomonadaceae bacterium StTr2]